MTLILPEGFVPEEIPRLTEATWLECGDPFPMLHHLARTTWSGRKFRLFAVACCRRIWHLIDADYAREAVDFAERLADGEASEEEAHARCQAMFARVYGAEPKSSNAVCACCDASATAVEGRNEWDAAFFAGKAACAAAAGNYSDSIPRWNESDLDEARNQSDLLRCIFGNPFRPAVINPQWSTSTVLNLATAIYEERAFDRLPILGDALEDVGCADAHVLLHCRQGGEHVKGCWVVDSLLGNDEMNVRFVDCQEIGMGSPFRTCKIRFKGAWIPFLQENWQDRMAQSQDRRYTALVAWAISRQNNPGFRVFVLDPKEGRILRSKRIKGCCESLTWDGDCIVYRAFRDPARQDEGRIGLATLG
ncbi:MAG: hypothetical protein K2R98_05455 [Gemmataceae bacterium]|nr:hypothetical protein [Gemmataceae bacterium]